MRRRWVELHDSDLVGLHVEGTNLVVRLQAYVHEWERTDSVWRGTGWSRPYSLVIHGASTNVVVAVPNAISAGTLHAGSDQYDNLLPLPFDRSGGVAVRLDLADGQVLELRGSGVELVASAGESKMIEHLPADMKPFE